MDRYEKQKAYAESQKPKKEEKKQVTPKESKLAE